MVADSIPVHLGYRPPSWYDDMDAMERMSALTRGAGSPHLAERPSVCDSEFWTSLGVQPVWSDEDTSVCVAAVDPGVDGLPELIGDFERASLVTVGASEPSPPVMQVARGFFSC